MSGSTEDSILSNIPDFRDESDADTSATDQTQTSAAPTQTSSQSPNTSAQPTDTDSQGSGTQPPTQQAFRRRHDGLLEQPSADNPKVRDLVDPQTGRVVAKGGIERHVFEEGQRHARENVAIKGQLQQLQGFVQSVGEVTREAARLNIKPEDQMIAMRVMSDFLRDPVKTVQYLVEEVKAKGYPIPFLEQGISPGMDMAAIGRMIDTKMAPLTQQQRAQQERAQVEQRATAELNTFLGNNPDANENLDVLAEMMQAQPSLTVQDAYTKMIRWAHVNDLDWTQPLKPQIDARRQAPQGQQPNHQQPTQQQQRPVPGRRSGGAGATPMANGADTGQQFNENASWADIIRASMQENGVRLN